MTLSRFVVLAVAGVAVACSSRSAEPANETSQSASSTCSTGPAYPEGTTFPVVDDSASYPTCTPRCGEGAPYTLAAVPSGACSADAPTCAIAVSTFCAGGSLGRVDSMRCACVAGGWSCAITAQGAGICPSSDAGPSR